MLPFTKRPGRGDESGDHDVVTKDDVAAAETVNPKAKGSGLPSLRAKFSSMSDDEMTNIMPSKSIGDALESARSSPRPAAGMPPPSPSSERTALRAAPSSKTSASSASRSGKFAAMDDEEEDGRTVVRGAPKIVKRGQSSAPNKMGQPTMPTTISPAAVIKATLESARAGQKKSGEHLMAPPPKDLLEDLSDRHPADGPGSEHTRILQATGSGSVAPPPMMSPMQSTLPLQAQQMSHGSIPPGSARPMSAAPPPMGVGHTTNGSGGYPSQQSGGYPAQYNGPVPSGSVSAPGVSMPASMPAHFMVPQAPYSDGRMDPPGTAVTARTKVAGRPAMSWAMAVMAFGLFVGVGAFAVMHGNADGFMETSASFVDPARAGAGAPKAAAAAAAPVAPAAAPAATDQPSIVGVPGVAVPGANPAAAAAPVVAGTAPATTAPVAAAPVAAAPVAAAPVAAAPPAAAPPAPVAAAPTAKPAHTSRPIVRPPAPAAEEPVAAAPAPTTKPGRGGKPAAGGAKPAGDSAVDEEQKKALKALQDSQLESTF